MRESYFYQLALTKKLRQLFVLVSMLTLPLGVWAQYADLPESTYNLWVQGTAVTDANKTDVLADGKVSYDSETNVLTLNGATVAGTTIDKGCILSGRSSLTISIIGENTIASTDTCTAILAVGTGEQTLTIAKGGDGRSLAFDVSRSIRDFYPVDYTNLYWNGIYKYQSENGYKLMFHSGDEAAKATGQVTFTPTLRDADTYNLWIGGSQVTSANAGNIMGGSGEGTLSFDVETNTLRFNGFSYAGFDSYDDPLIVNGLDDLTINLSDENFLWSGGLFLSKKSGDDDHSVTFTPAITIVDQTEKRGSLCFRTGGTDFCSGHTIAYGNGLGYSISDYDSDYHTYDIEVKVIDYGLTVGGTSVTSVNASNIFGEEDFPTAVYDNSSNTLTLRGCQYSGSENFIVLGNEFEPESLNVYLTGYNQVGNQSDHVFSAADASTINITTDATVPGKLVYFGSNVTDNNVTLNNGNSGLSLKDGESGGPEEGAKVISAEDVSSISYFGTGQFHDAQQGASQYTEEGYPAYDYSEGAWYYSNANTTNGLTDLPPTVSSSEGTSKMRKSGWDAIKSLTFQCVPVSGNDAITVALKSLEDNTTYATSTLTNGAVTLTPANASVTYDDVYLEFTSTSSFSFVPMAVKTVLAETYDIKIAGNKVTELNSSDVLGDSKVSYDNATHTLTLNGATIGNDDSNPGAVVEVPGIDYSGTADLTISLISANTIYGTEGCEPIRFNGDGETAPKLIFAKGNSQACKLQLTAQGETVISAGFGQIQGVNGISGATGNALVINADGILYDSEEKGLYSSATQDNDPVTSATILTDISAAYVAPIAEIPYTGSAVAPTIVVKATETSETSLVADTDYTVSYKQEETSVVADELINIGSYTAVIAGTGNYGGTQEVVFTIVKGSATITATDQTVTYNGDAQAYTNGSTTNGTLVVTYYSSAENRTADSEGTTDAPTNAGTYYVKVTLADGNYTADAKDATFTISPATITTASVTLNPEANLVYDGTVKHPEVTKVAYTPEGATEEHVFSAETDYDVSYSDGCISVGDYTTTVTFKGNYTGTATANFTIAAKNINGYTVNVDATQTYTYTGSAITPSVTVVPATGGDALILDTDYTVAYTNNTNAATAESGDNAPTVTVTGKGNYTGTASATFTIGKANATITKIPVAASELVYSGEPQALIATEGTANFGNVVYSLTETGTYGAAEDIKGTDATTYTIYYKVEGTDNFNGVEASTIEATITKADLAGLTVSMTGWAFGNTPDATTNAPTFNPELPSGVTAAFSYKGTGEETYSPFSIEKNQYPTAVGEYDLQAEVSGGTNYNDKTVSTTFSITKAAGGISYATTDVNKSFGDETFTNPLTKNGDGTVNYSSDKETVATVNSETGEVTIVGVGTANITATVADGDNYTYETKTASYKLTVSAKSLEGATVNVDATQTYTYTGSAIEPSVTVTLAVGGNALVLGTDYTVAYTNNTNAATSNDTSAPTVTVTGKGNYTGTATAKFDIGKADLNNVTIATIASQAFTGNPIEPALTVTFNELTVSDEDYSVAYSNNTEVGEATVTLTSKNKNFTAGSTKTATFQIVAATATITAQASQETTYNGSQQAITASVDKGSTFITYYSSEDNRINKTEGSTVAPTDAGTYYVQVTQGNANYASTPVDVTFTIKQAEITEVTLAETSLTYTGEAQTVNVTSVKAGELELTPEEYEVNGNTQTDAGTYTVTVTAKENGNFSGSKIAEFTINNRELEVENVISNGQTFGTFYSADEDFAVPEGYVAYVVTGVGTDAVTVQAVSKVKKGVPVLIESTDATVTTNDEATNILQYAQADIQTTGAEYVLYNGEFIKATGTISAGKCYLEVSTNAGARQRLSIRHEGEDTSGIENIQATEAENGDRWYDLRGRKLNGRPVSKGIYIRNGQKTVVK